MSDSRPIGFVPSSLGMIQVWGPEPSEMKPGPHNCNMLCRDGTHALVFFTNVPDDLTVADVQATADVFRANRSAHGVVVVEIERAPEAEAPAERPYAWVAWIRRGSLEP